jgi:hypothetical protein
MSGIEVQARAIDVILFVFVWKTLDYGSLLGCGKECEK